MGSSAGPVRILIADDQADVRSAFRMILDVQPDMAVVAEAADGVAAVAEARRLRPDVVLADIRMPRLDGLEVTRQLADECKVIVVTTFDLDDYVHTALRYGAAGFLLKRSGPVLLIEAVRAAMAGDALISPQITVRLLKHMALPGAEPKPGPGAAVAAAVLTAAGPAEELTTREKEIAELVADGATNAEIGAGLFISPGTVKNHLANIQRKLGARNRVGIAAWVWEQAAGIR
ncbi:response regulator transcription factor [Streptomyces sp. SP17BM10]|uniref:response regulator transcription factor n=1 Tax=Streptomyces sp. SP17BM10 TaxID=3002530 RepID=UPI002E790EAD|nr:response regulator transcription factor [Streptomyces sp. SP17BM10]MEE1789011.1 response regulator transcription factor [Streptomyces sp. SP17BM10]